MQPAHKNRSMKHRFLDGYIGKKKYCALACKQAVLKILARAKIGTATCMHDVRCVFAVWIGCTQCKAAPCMVSESISLDSALCILSVRLAIISIKECSSIHPDLPGTLRCPASCLTRPSAALWPGGPHCLPGMNRCVGDIDSATMAWISGRPAA